MAAPPGGNVTGSIPLMLDGRSARPPEVNQLDHRISLIGGSTSVLGFTAQRLHDSKGGSIGDPKQRIEELTREVGYLRQEVQFYRKCFENLQQLRETTYDVYQQLFLFFYFGSQPDRLQELTHQLHRGLESSVKKEVEAEKCWMEFWGKGSKVDNVEEELI